MTLNRCRGAAAKVETAGQNLGLDVSATFCCLPLISSRLSFLFFLLLVEALLLQQ